jgi:hypothetical protein
MFSLQPCSRCYPLPNAEKDVVLRQNQSYHYEVRKVKYIQSVPGGKVNILGDHSTGDSKKKRLYEHVSYFLR